MKKTDAQIRAWLEIKLQNFIPRIKGQNAYGSRKKLVTLKVDLDKIVIQLADQIYDE